LHQLPFSVVACVVVCVIIACVIELSAFFKKKNLSRKKRPFSPKVLSERLFCLSLRTATKCNTLQCTTAHNSTPPDTAKHCNISVAALLSPRVPPPPTCCVPKCVQMGNWIEALLKENHYYDSEPQEVLE